MKKFLAAALMIAFASSTAIAAGPVTVVLNAKNGNVKFNHKVHSSSFACKVCHGPGTPAKITLTKETAHKLCKGCHETKKAGPTRCGECHKKA